MKTAVNRFSFNRLNFHKMTILPNSTYQFNQYCLYYIVISMQKIKCSKRMQPKFTKILNIFYSFKGSYYFSNEGDRPMV